MEFWIYKDHILLAIVRKSFRTGFRNGFRKAFREAFRKAEHHDACDAAAHGAAAALRAAPLAPHTTASINVSYTYIRYSID